MSTSNFSRNVFFVLILIVCSQSKLLNKKTQSSSKSNNVNDDVFKTFEEFSNKEFVAVFLKLTVDDELVVEKTFEKLSHNKLMDKLPKDECRIILYWVFIKEAKLAIEWCPQIDGALDTDAYDDAFDKIKPQFNNTIPFYASYYSEMKYDRILEALEDPEQDEDY